MYLWCIIRWMQKNLLLSWKCKKIASNLTLKPDQKVAFGTKLIKSDQCACEIFPCSIWVSWNKMCYNSNDKKKKSAEWLEGEGDRHISPRKHKLSQRKETIDINHKGRSFKYTVKNEPSRGGRLAQGKAHSEEVPFSKGGHGSNLHAAIVVGPGVSSKMEQGWVNRAKRVVTPAWAQDSGVSTLGCFSPKRQGGSIDHCTLWGRSKPK